MAAVNEQNIYAMLSRAVDDIFIFYSFIGTYVLYWSQAMPGQNFGVLVHRYKKKKCIRIVIRCMIVEHGKNTKFWDQ